MDKANQSGRHALTPDSLCIFHMIDGISEIAHHRIDVKHAADAGKRRAEINDQCTVSGTEESSRRADKRHDAAQNDHLPAPEFLNHRYNNKEHRSHRSHRDHREFCLNGRIIAIGITIYDPARIIYL